MRTSTKLFAGSFAIALVAAALASRSAVRKDGPPALTATTVECLERAIATAAAQVRETRAGSTLSFGGCGAESWDSFFVVSPYAHPRRQAERLGLREASRLPNAGLGLGEMECMLAFVHRGAVVGSLVVKRALLDFSDHEIVHTLMPAATSLLLELREEFNGFTTLERVVARRS
ncbi:MAG: hypothetical protein IPH13_11690 [Planctomycetes bacterium]|nr:hypothetical protein [Planctomycetota bacterium]MCC7170452.1 hypothetical protein [Planctomycetota bacterium]